MSKLPILQSPTYELTLPILKKKIKYRPFTVKEQKILLLALEEDEYTFTLDNTKQILTNCLLSPIKINDLSIIDIEYFLIQLRARSVGEEVNVKYRCKATVDGETCDNLMDVNYNLLTITLEEAKNDPIIPLTPTIGIKLKFPEYSIIEGIKHSKNLAEITFDYILSCIDYVYDADKVYPASEYKKEELNEFLESLTVEQLSKVENFFRNIPKLQKKTEVICSKCGTEHKIVVEGLQNFFG